MGDTKENKTVSGSANSVYVSQAGESPGPELSELVNPSGFPSDEGERAAKKIGRKNTEARQEGHATIITSDELDKED